MQGGANEWVVIMRNGEMQRAGIGLACFRGIFDQVGIFPSKVNKVNFSTQQVTKEMSGLEVSIMIVWSIYREEDGPMRAFKYLGKDLCKDEPKTANSTLVSMSSAIVRNIIANSTIDSVIKNRSALRDAIRAEIVDVAKGWGVWLETIEITDVKILSSNLFRDMQAKYREQNRKNAKIQTLTNQQEIDDERRGRDFEKYKQQVDNEFAKKKLQLEIQLAEDTKGLKAYIQQTKLDKKKAQQDYEKEERNRKNAQ